APWTPSPRRPVRRCRPMRAALGQREAHHEAAAAIEAVTRYLDRAAVHLDQALHQREAEAQAVMDASFRAAGLIEEIEDARQVLGTNAPAFVSDLHRDVILLPLDRDLDARPARAVLAGVVEQVREHLREPDGI